MLKCKLGYQLESDKIGTNIIHNVCYENCFMNNRSGWNFVHLLMRNIQLNLSFPFNYIN